MKNLYILLSIFVLAWPTSSFCQGVKYEIKVVLNGELPVKGTLKKVSVDGISITDYQGKDHFFTSQHINKIKVRRKGLNFIESVGTGTGIGLAGGAIILLLADTRSEWAVTLVVGLATVGAIGGALGGLVGEALNTELVILIRNNPTTYTNNYLKLEKYLK